MTYEAHINATRSFLIAEDLLRKAGMGMAAAEMVWGAAVHVIDATSHRMGRRHPGNNRGRELIVEYLSNKHSLVILARGFAAIHHLHNHFYTGRLSHQELSLHLPTGIDFVNQMMELADREGTSS